MQSGSLRMYDTTGKYGFVVVGVLGDVFIHGSAGCKCRWTENEGVVLVAAPYKVLPSVGDNLMVEVSLGVKGLVGVRWCLESDWLKAKAYGSRIIYRGLVWVGSGPCPAEYCLAFGCWKVLWESQDILNDTGADLIQEQKGDGSWTTVG